MSEQPTRNELQHWANLAPEQVIEQLVHQLYSPVSILGSQLKRLTDDDDPISEDEYEAIFATMHNAVNQLSRTVVQLKRYSEGHKHP
jgi:polyphosphate kinase